MANDLQAYLASKYMSGPKAEAILAAKKEGSKKKSKKKNKLNDGLNPQSSMSHSSGMVLKDLDGEDKWPSGARDDELEIDPGRPFASSLPSPRLLPGLSWQSFLNHPDPF